MVDIFEKEELEQLKNLQTLSAYYQAILKFVKVYILLENTINKDDKFVEITDDDLKNFCEYYCADCFDFGDIFEEIDRFEIQKTKKKISKITLQIFDFGFLYTRIMRFPGTDFCIPDLTTTNLFEVYPK